MINFKDLEFDIFAGVNFKKIAKFSELKDKIKEFIEVSLKQLCKKENMECNHSVIILGETMMVQVIDKEGKQLLMGLADDSINIVEKKAIDFSYFEKFIPALLFSILESIERKEVEVLGMMFETSQKYNEKNSHSILSIFNQKFNTLKKEQENALNIKEDDIKGLGINLKFIKNNFYRDLVMNCKRGKTENNKGKVFIQFDTRFDYNETGVTLLVANADYISNFFRNEALAYFNDNIINNFAKDIIEISKEA